MAGDDILGYASKDTKGTGGQTSRDSPPTLQYSPTCQHGGLKVKKITESQCIYLKRKKNKQQNTSIIIKKIFPNLKKKKGNTYFPNL